jgi:hypothetical protein
MKKLFKTVHKSLHQAGHVVFDAAQALTIKI